MQFLLELDLAEGLMDTGSGNPSYYFSIEWLRHLIRMNIIFYSRVSV